MAVSAALDAGDNGDVVIFHRTVRRRQTRVGAAHRMTMS
jgi:hypothetical protein